MGDAFGVECVSCLSEFCISFSASVTYMVFCGYFAIFESLRSQSTRCSARRLATPVHDYRSVFATDWNPTVEQRRIQSPHQCPVAIASLPRIYKTYQRSHIYQVDTVTRLEGKMTHVLHGFTSPKYPVYTSFIAAKSFISAMNTLTLTTLSMFVPAASRTAERLAMI